MRVRSSAIRSLAVAAMLTVAANSAAAPAKPPLTPEQRKALFEQAGAIGQAHRQLSDLAGDWNVTATLTLERGKPAVVQQGTANFAMVLGGRHLRQSLHLDGSAFEGIGYIGYDNVTGEYFSSWMDTSFTGAMLAHGRYDAAHNAYTFHGGQNDPTGEAKVTPVREVLHIDDANRFSYEYYEVHGGKEAIAVRLDYTRVR